MRIASGPTLDRAWRGQSLGSDKFPGCDWWRSMGLKRVRGDGGRKLKWVSGIMDYIDDSVKTLYAANLW